MRIKLRISPNNLNFNTIEEIASDIEEKEIVLFVLLIYCRLYKNGSLFNAKNKNDINLLILENEIYKQNLPSEIAFTFFIKNINYLMDLDKYNPKNTKPSIISLFKKNSNYYIKFGFIHDAYLPNYYYLFSTILLIRPLIKSEGNLFDCLIRQSKILNNTKIGMLDAVKIPHSIISEYYK